jgi:WhiB family transcriptional regulator, redox-sensing transcriptional regulator
MFPTEIPPPGEWAATAACLHAADLNLWFPDPDDDVALAAAVAVCEECPVRTDCLDYAVRWRIDHGVWGGHTEDERRGIRRRRLVVV